MSRRIKNAPLAAALVAVLFLLAACSGAKLPGVYRLDIQQGNVITQEMLDQLELGMDRRKVRFILGTPLLTDTFNDNRWDYLYSLKKGSGDLVQRHVSLMFENDLLVSIQGDIKGEPEAAPRRTETIVTVPADRRKQGFLAGLVPDFLKRSPVKRSTATAAMKTPPSPDAMASATGSQSDASKGEENPDALSAEDSDYLRKLFDGYGKLGDGESQSTAESGRRATRDAESP